MWYGGLINPAYGILFIRAYGVLMPYCIVILHAWWVLGLWRIPQVKDMILWKLAFLHGLLACRSWQQEAVLLSCSHVSQTCHYLRNCYGFWETAWAHNYPPVKLDQGLWCCQRINTQACREMHTCAQANVQTYRTLCILHLKKGLLPNIMVLSSYAIMVIYVNTSGQYNFTHRHLRTDRPPLPP